MKVKVIKNFTDKNRNRYYHKGSTYEHTEEKRINELAKIGFVESPSKKQTSSKSSD